MSGSSRLGTTKEPTAAAVKGQQQGPMGSSNLKLHRLEANREVNYVGPDIHIESCETLIITSRDGPPKKLPEGPGSSMQPKGGGRLDRAAVGRRDGRGQQTHDIRSRAAAKQEEQAHQALGQKGARQRAAFWVAA